MSLRVLYLSDLHNPRVTFPESETVFFKINPAMANSKKSFILPCTINHWWSF